MADIELATHVQMNTTCSFATDTSTTYDISEPIELTVTIDDERNQDIDQHRDDEPNPTNPLQTDETTIDLSLPRDYLTAYILIRLNGTWQKLSFLSKFCILFGFVFSWSVQFTVFASLITDSVRHFLGGFVVSTSGEDLWYNLVAISSLMAYLWKDVMAHYHSTWFYVDAIEKRRYSGFHLSARRITATAVQNGSLSEIKRIDKSELVTFGQFRVCLVATFVLYAGFALYSLVAIAASSTRGIADELAVAINIFFVLEIDDWAFELFVIGPGVLDDQQFDVTVPVSKENGLCKMMQKRLQRATLLLIVSVAACYAMSYYHIAFRDDDHSV